MSYCAEGDAPRPQMWLLSPRLFKTLADFLVGLERRRLQQDAVLSPSRCGQQQGQQRQEDAEEGRWMVSVLHQWYYRIGIETDHLSFY